MVPWQLRFLLTAGYLKSVYWLEGPYQLVPFIRHLKKHGRDLTPIRMASVKNRNKITNVEKGMETLVRKQNHTTAMKNRVAVPEKTKNRITVIQLFYVWVYIHKN